jgi:hypothetical protein
VDPFSCGALMPKDTDLRNINLLFLIVVVLQATNLLFLWVPQYVRLLLNEALFVSNQLIKEYV